MPGPMQEKRILKSAGLKVTSQRLLVLDALKRAHHPLTAPQIHEKLTPGPDRATVYRVLEAFVEAGLAAKLRHGPGAQSYHLVHESLRPRHPHFYCTSCGKSSCLEAGAVGVDLSVLGRTFPARVEHLEISLQGICPACLHNRES